MSSKLAHLIQKIFCSDQNSYIMQNPDGNYHRTYGVLDAGKINTNISQKKSFGSYQKNLDSTINWICFDFDVAREHVEKPSFENLTIDLNKVVDEFCDKLTLLEIPFLLEFSGSRGMHVWIVFSDRIEYSYGYMIAKAIIEATELVLPPSILLDLFPASKKHSDGVGIGVKLPLSKHTRSGWYSLLLNKDERSTSALKTNSITSEIIDRHAEILSIYKPISKVEIETILVEHLELEEEQHSLPLRIKEINISSKFNFTTLSKLWSTTPPLAKILHRISIDKTLALAERKLIVGLFSNIKLNGGFEFSNKFLHHLFSKIENYDRERTEENLQHLSKFNFPTQEQIESVTAMKFTSTLTSVDLINLCIPNVSSFIDSTMEILVDDIENVRKAEIKYILQNDEVYSKRLLTEINYRDGREILADVLSLLNQTQRLQYYVHDRVEEKKIRKLMTLGLVGRMATSAILSQLTHLINFLPSSNSHGYQINRGFKDGYIFKPWLNLWVRFVKNISSALENTENHSFYIVKTDIESFYDTVPHENLKRLLLGGVNKRIDAKLNQASSEVITKYRFLLESLFAINAALVKTDRGLPQGPAYARFLAEIYIDNIDSEFDAELNSGEIFLYQRYVDDIFFICETEDKARTRLNILEKSLQTLGLKINHEKTIVARISDFSSDFRTFTSQSKYVVDRASRNFESTTSVEKDLAINEFIQIVQSDSCEDDLAFIFSHLAGVPMLDSLKAEKVLPTLKSGIGRGSMLRHLFAFVLASDERWPILLQIDKFTSLQSEVLTSSLLSKTFLIEENIGPYIEFIRSLIPKLTRSQIVNEHLAYLSFTYGVEIDKSNFSAELFLDCIASYPDPQNIILSEHTIRMLSVSLNSQQSMAYFVDKIYPLCISKNTPKNNLNELAQTFYSKVSNDYRLRKLTPSDYPEMLYEAPATKFYHLLCLFCLSDQNNDINLLKDLWRYATEIHNSVQPATRNVIHSDEWFSKLGQININARTNNLVVSSIVEGAMYRGGHSDRKNIFDRFHNLLIIFISGSLESDTATQIETILRELKSKANFYKWILERENVSIFPGNNWFEKNVCDNNIIILKRGTEVLIRRPTENFINKENLGGDHNGYSERIESYDESKFVSLKDALEGLSLAKKIEKLITMVDSCQPDKSFPNIYSFSRLVNKQDLSPFTEEVRGSKKILFEDGVSSIISLKNSTENFIQCFFRTNFDDENTILFIKFRDKYLANISHELDMYKIVKCIKNELEQMNDPNSEVYLDFAVGSALYLSLGNFDSEKKLELFINTYEKFNKESAQQHIFCVTDTMSLDDSTPLTLIKSVNGSLKLITEEVMPSSPFNLVADIEDYLKNLEQSVENNTENSDNLNISDFKRTRITMLQTEEKIDARDAGEFHFSKIFVVNIKLQLVEKFESGRHPLIIGRATHIYQLVRDGKIYFLPIFNSIGKIFDSLCKRHVNLVASGESKSYPIRVAGEIDTSVLSDFNVAVRNVAIQRDIGTLQAESLLKSWLASIPTKYLSSLCTLIAAHVVMTPGEVTPFVQKVSELISNPDKNPIFIKRIGDINGTHRILMRDSDAIRRAEEFGPHSIADGSTSITLIADVLVSGTQIVKALKYYLLSEGMDQKYYLYPDDEKVLVATKLKSVKEILIVNVFHTTLGLQYIQEECRKFMDSEIRVISIHGRDIGDDAIFSTSKNISATKKLEIRNLFNDKDLIDDLFDHLNIFGRKKDSSKDFKDTKIDGIDLVARYQSLTKKCFYFLHAGPKHNYLCRPFIRARESYELTIDPLVKKTV